VADSVRSSGQIGLPIDLEDLASEVVHPSQEECPTEDLQAVVMQSAVVQRRRMLDLVAVGRAVAACLLQTRMPELRRLASSSTPPLKASHRTP
jgi:hypothetical protein